MSISSDSSDEEIVDVPAPVVVEPKKKRAYVRKTPLTIEAKEKQCLQLQKAREARKKPVVAWEPVEPDSPIEEPVKKKKEKKEPKEKKEKPVKEEKEKPVKEPKKPKKEKPVEVHHHHYPETLPPPLARSKSIPMTFA